MSSFAPSPHEGKILKCGGFNKALPLFLILFFKLAHANHHQEAPTNVTDPTVDASSFDAFISYEDKLDKDTAPVTGGYSVFHNLIIEAPDGLIIFPIAGARNAFNHGKNILESPDPNIIINSLNFEFKLNSPAIPSGVDLGVNIEKRDLLTRRLWSGSVATIVKPDDGMLLEDRPNFTASADPITLTDGRGTGDLMLQLKNMILYDNFFNPVLLSRPGVKAGEYCFRIQLTNKCGLVSTYGFTFGNEPFPVDFPASCTVINSGAFDCTPPIPVALTATPEFVQSGEDVKVNVSVRITDLGTGFQFGNLVVKGGVPPGGFSRTQIGSKSIGLPGVDETSEGTIKDFTFTTEFDLSASQFSGDFLSFCLDLTDCVGNTRRYDSSICNFKFQATPLPCDYAQLLILAAFGENDYLARANIPGTFKEGTPPELRVWDADADGDFLINLFEIILGTDPSDPNSLFRAVLKPRPPVVATKSNSANSSNLPVVNASDHEGELRIDFSPYNPAELIYTLYNVFEGENNDERVPIVATPTLD